MNQLPQPSVYPVVFSRTFPDPFGKKLYHRYPPLSQSEIIDSMNALLKEGRFYAHIVDCRQDKDEAFYPIEETHPIYDEATKIAFLWYVRGRFLPSDDVS